MSTTTRKLIVNADDFGMSKEVNEGIMLVHLRGCVTSTSAFVNQPASDELRHLARRAPRLGVGLHLNCTLGRPVAPFHEVPSLVDGAGNFYDATELMAYAYQINPDHLRQELRAQVGEFRRLFGRDPDHLDVHQYSLCFFGVGLQVFLELAAELDIPVRNCQAFLEEQPLAQLLERIETNNQVDLGHLKAGDLSRQLEGIWREHRPPRSPGFWEHRFHGNCEIEELLAMLSEMPAGVNELMCHPASRFTGATPFDQGRPRECYLLTHPSVLECLRGSDWTLATFADAFA